MAARFCFRIALVAGALALTPAAPLVVLLPSSEAFAQTAPKIATVDFQRAINEVNEGAAARAKLDGMFKEKKAAIDAMGKRLESMKAEYDKQSMILSEAARKQKEQDLTRAQMEYQQVYMQSEGEMQQMYMVLMEDLIAKMKKTCADMGKEKGFNLVLETSQGAVVYSGGTTDLTDDLVKRFNAASPGK